MQEKYLKTIHYMGNRFRRAKKISIYILLIISVGLISLFVFSPYGKKDNFSYKLIINTVEINASVDSVFKFLGKSSNASKWSVYVNHITPLNADTVPDGQPGSKRRCFQNADETGIWWDELITEVEKNKKRQLRIYNTHNFPFTADSLATEQLYESIGKDKCKLSFTLFFYIPHPGWFNVFKMHLGSFKVKSIYKQNMNNIKRIIEEGK